jgi:high-affinity iron transporter
VGREGFETALFLWPTVKAAGSESSALAGAVLGLVCAVVVGYLIYKRAVTLNLAIFFRVTGVALIVIASGVLAYGVSDLQEARLLPGANSIAFDLSNHISPDGFVGTLLKGTVSLSPTTTWLQLVVHLAYLTAVMVMFLRPMPRLVLIAATDPAIEPAVDPASKASGVTPKDSVAM